MTLASFVAEKRNEQGLSQVAFAEKCGISSGTIASLEVGKHENPTAETIQALARGLGVSINEIFNAITKPEPKRLTFKEAYEKWAHGKTIRVYTSSLQEGSYITLYQGENPSEILAFLDLAERKGWPVTEPDAP